MTIKSGCAQWLQSPRCIFDINGIITSDVFSFLSAAAIFAESGIMSQRLDFLLGAFRDGKPVPPRCGPHPAPPEPLPAIPRPPLLHSHRSAAEEVTGVAGEPSTSRGY